MQTIFSKRELFCTKCDLINTQNVNSVHSRMTIVKVKAQLKSSMAITELWQQKELMFLFYLLFFRLPLIFFEPLKKFKRKALLGADPTIKLISHIQKKTIAKLLCDIFLRVWTDYPAHNLYVNANNKLTKLNVTTKTSVLFYDRIHDIEFFAFKIKYHIYFLTSKIEKQKVKILLLNYPKIRSIYNA